MQKLSNNYAFIDGQNLYLAIRELGKFLKVLAPSTRNCSLLLKKVAGNQISFVSDLRKKLEYKRKEPRKDETL